MNSKRLLPLIIIISLLYIPFSLSDSGGGDGGDSEYCDFTYDECQIICKGLIIDKDGLVAEDIIRGIHIRAYDVDESDDHCLAPTSGELGIENGKNGVKVNYADESGDYREMNGIVNFNDYKQFHTGIIIKSENNQLKIEANNGLDTACQGTYISWSAVCSDSNEVHCICNIYQEGENIKNLNKKCDDDGC
ncbi:hypothetical protein HZA96_02910 [Candidatus Woesearchaeota archaeon]|nr:hypothetical protein [Candidatus Woesearchaeota archaeon]